MEAIMERKSNVRFSQKMLVCLIPMIILLITGCANRDKNENNLPENQISNKQEHSLSEEQLTNHTQDASTNGQTTSSAENPPSNNQGDASANEQEGQAGIGLEAAKEIALQHAGMSASEVTFFKEEQEYEDGQIEYKIDFVTATTKYEYEISVTGSVLESSQEPIEQIQENFPIEGIITVEEAKAAALGAAQVTADQIAYTKVELDYEDGRAEYEIEFYVNGIEYSCIVDAVTSKVLELEME